MGPLAYLTAAQASTDFARKFDAGNILFGGRRKRRRSFQFEPDMNDPSIRLAYGGISHNADVSRQNAVNEISRAGLLGSSSAASILRGVDTEAGRSRSEALDSILSHQRDQQMQLYQGDRNYDQSLDLLDRQDQNALGQSRMNNIQDIFDTLGGLSAQDKINILRMFDKGYGLPKGLASFGGNSSPNLRNTRRYIPPNIDSPVDIRSL